MRDQEKKEHTLPGTVMDRADSIAIYAGVVCVGIILVILMTCERDPERLADNKILALIALLIMIPIFILYGFFVCREKKFVKYPLLWLALGYVILFAAQLFWVNRVYFYTSWDAGLMKFRADAIVNGGSMESVSADVGYSTCPNNLFLFYVICVIEKIGKLLSMREPYHLCIYISCLCVNLSCFLGNLIIRKLTDSGIMRGCYFIFSTLLILFSPWIIIPYSDTYGMVFVMLGMWGLVCLEKKYLKWVVVASAAMIGYCVKPSCLFPLFAAYMVYGVRYMLSIKEHWKELLALIGGTLLFGGVSILIPVWIQHTYSFRLNPDLELPSTHYLMMGFNWETSGGFSVDDYIYSVNLPDLTTRKQANKEEFSLRFRAFLEQKMLLKFLRKKAVVNFNDGTFAWTGEGSFFIGYVEHDSILAEWFQETMVPPGVWENEGKYYYLYRTVMQTIWLAVLMGILFTGMAAKEKRKHLLCMMIVICGLIAFVMLFEARARYLFLYAPIFLILSLCGWESLFRRGRKLWDRKCV
ncbi:MAG: hypothetical protein NC123_07365 [Butyrivibrio sp.]|nr:hypothetical protein [Butyrivibrio sp.]